MYYTISYFIGRGLRGSLKAVTMSKPMKLLWWIKAMLTAEGTTNGPENEMDKDKDVYGTISSIWKLVIYVQCGVEIIKLYQFHN